MRMPSVARRHWRHHHAVLATLAHAGGSLNAPAAPRDRPTPSAIRCLATLAVMREMAVVALVEPMRAGGVYDVGRIPLHVTVLPNIRIDESHAAGLATRIEALASSTAELIVGIGSAEMFGRQSDIAVTVIESSPPLQRLHGRCSPPRKPSQLNRSTPNTTAPRRLTRSARIRRGSIA